MVESDTICNASLSLFRAERNGTKGESRSQRNCPTERENVESKDLEEIP